MSEQMEQERVQRPTIQAKYRYLSDFSKQESPNLRKQYRQSLSPHEISNQNRSPSRKCSPYRSSHKKVSRIQRYSPSCSTFNPRREPTQQQFSPYDDRADKEQSRINNQLRQQNMELRTQLIQSKQLIDSLRAELNRRDIELVQIRQNSQADMCYFQKVVSQMTGEIQIVLTKNKILENELIVVKSKLQEQSKRVEEYARYEEERKRTEKRRLQLSKFQDQRRLTEHKRKEDFDRQQQKLKDITNKTTNQPPSRRSVGKLMSKPTAHHYQSKNQSLQTSKIKIQDQLQSSVRQNCENKRIDNLPPRPQQEKQKEAKKGQQLIQSILGMQLKITGHQATSLKQLWKWLKEMGHSQSCLKRWKPKAEAGIYLNTQRLRQLVRQACSYIQ